MKMRYYDEEKKLESKYVNDLKEKFEELLKKTVETKTEAITFLQSIKEEKMTACRAYEGKEYRKSNYKIMIVGRAMNGWLTFDATDTSDTIIEKIMDKPGKYDYECSLGPKPFCDVVNHKGNPYKDKDGNDKLYFYARSKFWKLIKYLIYKFEGQDIPEYDWFYNCDNAWHQKIVWSNLYKISPKDGGNPNEKQIRAQEDICAEILKLEIEYYQPQYILFITDNWYLDLFTTICGECKSSEEQCSIVAENIYKNAKVIVCKRPDKRNVGNNYVKTMAQQIYDAFEHIVKR